jgi:hypothetical protein
MEGYSVKKLAKLAGVSVRTLHLYDRLGLLKPRTRTEARYRLYGETELLRLQQILFYKELDFPCKPSRPCSTTRVLTFWERSKVTRPPCKPAATASPPAGDR